MVGVRESASVLSDSEGVRLPRRPSGRLGGRLGGRVSADPAVPADPASGMARRGRSTRPSWAVLAAISVGGAIGAVARYSLAVAVPHRAGQFPWATFLTNVSGCLLIGVLMVLINEVWPARRLLRPFLGVGVLGGYTTFSTYSVDVQQLVTAGSTRDGLVYLAGTLVTALLAVYAGSVATWLLIRVHPRRKEAG